MTDPRITEALRSLQPELRPDVTEEALREVQSQARRRRQRTRAGAAVAVAAGVALLVGAVAVLDRDDGPTAVVGGQPTTDTTATTTTVPSTVTTTVTTAPTREVGTFEDLPGGVTGLGLHTWWTSDPVNSDGLWRADPDLAAAVAAAAVASGGIPLPETTDIAIMRLELLDGRVVFGAVDLESGWVGQVNRDFGPIEPGGMLPDDVTYLLRTGFNDAVGTPWEEPDGGLANPYVSSIIQAAGFPIADLDAVPATVEQALLASGDTYFQYGLWSVEVTVEGHGPVVEIRRRGNDDDSVRGTDLRLSLVDTPDGWDVDRAEWRNLCLRSTPGPPPHYGCL